jgi:hypothetical protein
MEEHDEVVPANQAKRICSHRRSFGGQMLVQCLVRCATRGKQRCAYKVGYPRRDVSIALDLAVVRPTIDQTYFVGKAAEIAASSGDVNRGGHDPSEQVVSRE